MTQLERKNFHYFNWLYLPCKENLGLNYDKNSRFRYKNEPKLTAKNTHEFEYEFICS